MTRREIMARLEERVGEIVDSPSDVADLPIGSMTIEYNDKYPDAWFLVGPDRWFRPSEDAFYTADEMLPSGGQMIVGYIPKVAS